jgi:hypothetical protein
MRGYGARTYGWLVLLACLVWPLPGGAQPATNSCMACHRELGVERLTKPVQEFEQDIHRAKGFGCVSCHGGDATQEGMMEAMDPAKGYIGKPTRQQIPEVCGHCHSDARFMKRYNPAMRVDQVTEYYTSVHGQRLREFNDTKVATCASCHPAHTIRPPSDPKSSVHPLQVAETCGTCHADPQYMKPYDIPTDQLQMYRKSIHWKTMKIQGDLSAPTCNDCHGNHGAAPPGISWVGNVCEQCHAVVADLFAESPHDEIFVQIGTPGCPTCHSNHDIAKTTDAMVGLGSQAVCATCHTADDTGGKTAVAMRESIDALRAEFDKAQQLLRRAEHAGMEVSQAQFELNGAKDHLVKARTAVHTFTVKAVKQEVAAGTAIATKAHARGVRALDELQFRRMGLGVSVVIILAVIAGLVFKIRQIHHDQ